METLAEIYKKYAVDSHGVGISGDKGTTHSYIEVYELILLRYRLLYVTILEVGVADGLSLRMWEDYFPYATIHGIDINPNCKQFESERSKIFIGDTTQPIFLTENSLHEITLNRYDVIIDDGSHIPHDQILTFNNLFPLLKDGGLYVTEDCQGVGYMESTMRKLTKNQVHTEDLRAKKNRHDDVMVWTIK